MHSKVHTPRGALNAAILRQLLFKPFDYTCDSILPREALNGCGKPPDARTGLTLAIIHCSLIHRARLVTLQTKTVMTALSKVQDVLPRNLLSKNLGTGRIQRMVLIRFTETYIER